MSTSRRAFLSLLFAALIGGSFYDIVRDEEHWPFSQYPMFRGVWRSPTFKWPRVFGVTADGHEWPLQEDRYIQPFDQSRLASAFRRVLQMPDGQSRLNEALSELLVRYDQLAAERVHDGPPLAGLRLYELEWTIDAAATNVARPDRRRLLGEVVRR
jgi:hypothetical protein